MWYVIIRIIFLSSLSKSNVRILLSTLYSTPCSPQLKNEKQDVNYNKNTLCENGLFKLYENVYANKMFWKCSL